MSTKKKLFYGIMGILTVIKIWMGCGLRPYGISNSDYDDMLFIRQAHSIARGEWLGEFSKFTLLKRPMFGIFLACVKKLHLSYRMTVQCMYVLAVILFVCVISKCIKSYLGRGAIYVFLLFTPAMFNFSYVQRVYRMAVVPAAVLYVITGFIALFIYAHAESGHYKKIAAWSVYTGFNLFFFWNMREDSVWILPFCIVATIIAGSIAFYRLRKKMDSRKEFLFKAVCLCVPFLLMMAGNTVIKSLNYKYYGVYTDSEMNNSEFASLMSTIYSVKSDESYEYVNVDKNTFYRIMETSPTMTTLKPYIDDMYKSGWTKDNGQIPGGYISYAFRDVLKKAGYYEGDAKAKEEICKKMNAEIKEAIADGRLEAEGGLYSVSYLLGKKGANLPLFFEKYGESLKWVITGKKMNAHQRKSSGSPELLREMEIVTGDILIYPDMDINGKGEKEDPIVGHGTTALNLVLKVIALYQKTGWLMFALAAISFVLLFFKSFDKKQEAKDKEIIIKALVVQTGILLSALLLIGGVTYRYAEARNSEGRNLYMAGAYPLYQIWVVGTIVLAVIYVLMPVIKKNREKKS
ncbi:MAG: hypothetical protein IKS48_12035 [Eubacterium sp.]|nr:hypothetical protein [Eubacterium sp.]